MTIETTTLLHRCEQAETLMQSLILADWRNDPGFESPDVLELLRAAEQLGVDPRWLATGEYSPAGEAAAKILIDSGYVAGDEAISVARMTPQPEGFPGVCRYCGCTDECGCGDCTWIDEACTICSACLEEQP